MEEKGRASVMDGIPAALPALAYAAKVQKKAESQGVAWRTLLGDGPRTTLGRAPARAGRRGPRRAAPTPRPSCAPPTSRLRHAFDARSEG